MRIRNSARNNIFGDGKEKIMTLDNGDEYIIRNSARNNIFGDGKEKIITKRNNCNESLISLWILPIIVLFFFMIESFLSSNIMSAIGCLIGIIICNVFHWSKYFYLKNSIKFVLYSICIIIGSIIILYFFDIWFYNILTN